MNTLFSNNKVGAQVDDKLISNGKNNTDLPHDIGTGTVSSSLRSSIASKTSQHSDKDLDHHGSKFKYGICFFILAGVVSIVLFTGYVILNMVFEATVDDESYEYDYESDVSAVIIDGNRENFSSGYDSKVILNDTLVNTTALPPNVRLSSQAAKTLTGITTATSDPITTTETPNASPGREVAGRSLGGSGVSENDIYNISQTNSTFVTTQGTGGSIQNYPWQVYLRGDNEPTSPCGGTIIKPSWILIAAHCVTSLNNKAKNWKVYAGITERNNSAVFSQEATGTKFVIHKKFSETTYENDIALLQISPGFDYNDVIRPICLPPKNLTLPTGTYCDITGWAKEDGRPSMTLQAAKVTLLSRYICNVSFWLDNIVTVNMLCAGNYTGLTDGCVGDSGGPLACSSGSGEQQYLYGILSWGIGCAQAAKPGVYTRVTKYIDWIEYNTN